MKKETKAKKSVYVFIVVFFLILLYPVYGGVFDERITLSGVSAAVTLEAPTQQTVMDGSYQSNLNTWVENNFPGRNLMIKLRSQLRYSLLNESPNDNVQIGKDKYLFESNYITSELAINVTDEAFVPELINKLETLQNLMHEQGKEMYVFITPSKAYYCKDKIPAYYFNLEVDRDNDYEVFIKQIQDSNLHYFDCRTFIDNYAGPELEAPVYYPTGIHWSSSYGFSAAKALTEYISKNGKWNLSTLQLIEGKTETPVWPDADLYQSLNLVAKPSDIQYYTAELSVVEAKDCPNVFCRGGSFMGQSMNGLIRAGVFNKNVHLENNYYFTDCYSASGNLSSYTAYDEIENLVQMLAETDIFILEVNEANIGGMSFGFVDYLLEHPDYLKYPES